MLKDSTVRQVYSKARKLREEHDKKWQARDDTSRDVALKLDGVRVALAWVLGFGTNPIKHIQTQCPWELDGGRF